MLAASSVGTVEYRSITEPARLSNPLVQYVEGVAVASDPFRQTIDVELAPLLAGLRPVVEAGLSSGHDGHAEDETVTLRPYNPRQGKRELVRIKYDTLVVACGQEVSASRVPGAEERCFKLKEVDDARRLRRAIGEAYDLASRPDMDTAEQFRLLHFVIVGGGPTGVELAGELTDFIRESARLYPFLAPLARVTVVQGAQELLMQFDESLRGEAKKGLEKRGVRVRTNVRVERVEDDHIVIRSKDGDDSEILPCGLTVWCAGNTPVPFVSQLLDSLPPSARSPDARLAVDPWLRVRLGDVTGPEDIKQGSILAMGDVAFVCDEDATDDAGIVDGALCEPLPQTAQVAAQEGAYVARLLNRDYDLSSTPPALGPPKEIVADAVTEFWNRAANVWVRVRGLQNAPKFSFLNLGILAAIGGGEALAQVELGDQKILKQAGSAGFLLWRSVYIVKQVAIRNRVLVTFDWIKTAIFGRDLTRF